MTLGSAVKYAVDFNTVSTVGLEASPVAAALAGLRANEARCFKSKYDHVFVVESAREARATIDRAHRILAEAQAIVIGAAPLQASGFQIDKFASRKSKLAGTMRARTSRSRTTADSCAGVRVRSASRTAGRTAARPRPMPSHASTRACAPGGRADVQPPPYVTIRSVATPSRKPNASAYRPSVRNP